MTSNFLAFIWGGHQPHQAVMCSGTQLPTKLTPDNGLGKASFSAFFASLLLARSQPSSTDWGREALPTLQEGQARGHRDKLHIQQVHGARWDAPEGAGDAGQHHCEATLSHLWKVIATRIGP